MAWTPATAWALVRMYPSLPMMNPDAKPRPQAFSHGMEGRMSPATGRSPPFSVTMMLTTAGDCRAAAAAKSAACGTDGARSRHDRACDQACVALASANAPKAIAARHRARAAAFISTHQQDRHGASGQHLGGHRPQHQARQSAVAPRPHDHKVEPPLLCK